MCGIVGLVRARKGRSDSDGALARAMADTIVHRGPDDMGVLEHDRGFIGMRRLSIIDVSGGHQPIHNEDRSIWVVFNGEIYNYVELTAELEERGHRFYTKSDAECIVHAFEEWGSDFAAHLRGMFAVALWDEVEQTLVLARDPLGKKPLYLHDNGERLAFGSELKALLPVPDVGRELSRDALTSYLTLGYVAGPHAIFQGIQKLLPGHVLEYREGVARTRRYWVPASQPKLIGTSDELLAQLHTTLDEAVRLRMRSDVPFGAFLSGGLDSGVVATLMAKHLDGAPLHCFTIGFNEASHDEVDGARQVARHLGAQHSVEIAETNAVDLLPELVWHLDEPFADPSVVPTWLVCRMAARHVKMVVSGDGGDEAFAGYTRYQKYLRLLKLREVAGNAPAWAFGLAGWMLPGNTGLRAGRIGRRLRARWPEDYLAGVALTPPHVAQAMAPAVYRAEAGYGAVGERLRGLNVLPPLDRVTMGDLVSYLVDDVLVKVDRMSMGNSLEVRSPILDQEVMTFAQRLPDHLRLRNGVGKQLFRRLAAELLPPELLDRPKQGFGIPLDRWFRGDLRELAGDTFASAGFRSRGVFSPLWADRVFNEHQAGTDHGEALWQMLVAETWFQQYCDQPVTQVVTA